MNGSVERFCIKPLRSNETACNHFEVDRGLRGDLPDELCEQQAGRCANCCAQYAHNRSCTVAVRPPEMWRLISVTRLATRRPRCRWHSLAALQGPGAAAPDSVNPKCDAPTGDDLSWIMTTESASLKAHLHSLETSHANRVELTDEDVEKVADYAHLHFERGTPDFTAIKADLSSVLTTASYVNDYLRQRAAQQQPQPSGVAAPSPPEDGRLLTPPGPLEEIAAARLGELRKDVVTEGGDAEAVLKHAAKREGQFFTVPRTVEA